MCDAQLEQFIKDILPNNGKQDELKKLTVIASNPNRIINGYEILKVKVIVTRYCPELQEDYDKTYQGIIFRKDGQYFVDPNPNSSNISDWARFNSKQSYTFSNGGSYQFTN